MMVNVGCGSNPTPGWENYDNSPSLLLSKSKPLVSFMERFQLLSPGNIQVIHAAQKNKIFFANASKFLPIASDKVDAIYTSHMLEHFDRQEAEVFLLEAFRILKTGGILRIVVPDFRRMVQNYIQTNDLNALLEKSLLTMKRPKNLFSKLRLAFLGPRHHLWMYDEASLVSLALKAGFVDASPTPFGITRIPNPGELNLQERAEESICVEATKP